LVVAALSATLGVALTSCSSSTGPGLVEYTPVLVQQTLYKNAATGEWIDLLLFQVQHHGAIIIGARMHYTPNAGLLEDAERFTDGGGYAEVTWSTFPAERVAVASPILTICANNSGASFTTCSLQYVYVQPRR
jgi:hypothetical protein